MRAPYHILCEARNVTSSTVLIFTLSITRKVSAVYNLYETQFFIRSNSNICTMYMRTQVLIVCVYFLDYGILERHSHLDNTIGVLDMEMESYERSKLMAWIFYPTWILLTILQAVCFILYNGKFHPLSTILDGCNVEKKGASKLGTNTMH